MALNKVITGVNDLLTIDPEGAKEWNYKKNSELDLQPDKVAVTSHKKVWWICPEGHEYEMALNCHARGYRCQYCSNRKVLSGFNDFATLYPQYVDGWDYNKNDKKPNEIAPSGTYKAWFICKKGHSYQQQMGNRVHGEGCPVCTNKIIVSGVNDLATLHPEALNDWDFELNNNINMNPHEIASYFKGKTWWKCKKGHSYDISPSDYISGNRCPFCANARLLTGFNDLLTIDPEGAKEWDEEKNGKKASEVLAGTKKKVWWICSKCGISYDLSMDLHKNGVRCGFCKGIRIQSGHNDLLTKDPDGCEDWDFEENSKIGLDPTKLAPNSTLKANYKCLNGHKYIQKINSHTQGLRCPYCSNKALLSGYNDLLTRDPEGTKEWNYEKNKELRPDMVMPYTTKKVWWICPKGHDYEMAVSQHTLGYRCQVCNESKGEKIIDTYLREHNIKFKPQYTDDRCKNVHLLIFDFAILKNNEPILIIEYDGEGHYKPITFGGCSKETAIKNLESAKIRDKIKNDFCKENNIPMLRIPYWKFDKIESILEKELKKHNLI